MHDHSPGAKGGWKSKDSRTIEPEVVTVGWNSSRLAESHHQAGRADQELQNGDHGTIN